MTLEALERDPHPLLARAETHAALDALLALPRLRLDPARPAAPRGLIFRKPPALYVTWDP